jgi:hypothetical protein
MFTLDHTEQKMAEAARYDIYGLRYSIEHLYSLDVEAMTMTQMAEYADAVTYVKTLKRDRAFMEAQLQTMNVDCPNVNMTALGNLAHTAIHFPDDEIALRFAVTYQKCKEAFLRKRRSETCAVH